MLKDEECKKLEHVRDQMCEELEELTAKLFEVFNFFLVKYLAAHTDTPIMSMCVTCSKPQKCM